MLFRQFFDDADDAAAKAAADAETARKAAEGTKKKEYTDAELEAIILKRSEQARRQAKDAVEKLEQFKTTHALTEQQKQELDVQIEELKRQNMTAEEIRKRDLHNAETKHAGELKVANEKATTWQQKHDNLMVTSDLDRSAIKHGVIDGVLPVVTAYLKPLTRVSDAGQGVLVATVSFPDVGADGKEFTATLTIDKAVARMKELPQFAPLFKGTATGGAGGSGGSGKPGKPGSFDFKKGDMAEYMAQRNKK
jgi:hypothetical protein